VSVLDVARRRVETSWLPGRLTRVFGGSPPSIWLGLGCGTIAFWETVYVTRFGVGGGNDAASYLAAAKNLATGHGLRDLGGGPFVSWPPGFPVAIAIGEVLGFGGAGFARYLNAFAFGLTVLLAFVLLRRHVNSRLLVWLGTAWVTASYVLLQRTEQVLSEPGFILLTLCLVVSLEGFLKASRRWPWLVAAAVSVWLAFAFRYAGYLLLPACALAILVGARTMTPRVRGAWAVSFLALAAAFPVAWTVRNHIVSGDSFGGQSTLGASSQTVGMLFERTTRYMGRWIDPWTISVRGDRAAFLLLVALVLSLAALPRDRRRLDRGESLAPVTGVALCYGIGILVVGRLTAIGWLDDRFFSPLYVPLLVLAFTALDTLRQHFRGRRVLLASAAIFLIALSIGRVVEFANTVRVDSRHIPWKPNPPGVYIIGNSQRVGDLARDLPAKALLYSNNPEEAAAATGRGVILLPPQKQIDKAATAASHRELATFVRNVSCHQAYFAWRMDKSDKFLPPATLRHFVRFQTIVKAPRGALYRLKPLRSSSAACH
jgi:hypothetical protein